MENEIEELLQEFEEKSNRPFLHTVCFYWHTSQIRNKRNQITISLWTHTHTHTNTHMPPHTPTPHSSVYSTVRKQLCCQYSVFRSGPQKWLLLDRMMVIPLRGRTCCSAFVSCSVTGWSRPPSQSWNITCHLLREDHKAHLSGSVSFEDHSWSVRII